MKTDTNVRLLALQFANLFNTNNFLTPIVFIYKEILKQKDIEYSGMAKVSDSRGV